MSGEIVTVRHGETEWSVSGRHTGRTDITLTENGCRQALALGGKLRERSFALVLVSPLRRARETCELAGFGDLAEVCDDLREWEYGDYEGLTTAEIRERNPDWVLWRDGCPRGETPDQVSARADRAIERLRAGAGETGDADEAGDRLAFAHGHILRVLAARWIGMEVAAGARLMLAAAGVSVLGVERGNEVLVHWNETS